MSSPVPAAARRRTRCLSAAVRFPSLPLVLPLLLLALCPRHTAGHAFLTHPRGDFKTVKKADCRVGGPKVSDDDTCRGPCIEASSWQYDPAHPRKAKTVYRRGQRVTLEWTRNNHRGGFVRFTLVPRAQRMSHAAHNAHAFHFACFEAGLHSCRVPALCGSDTTGRAYRTAVTVPSHLADGDYVLGWAWFGGTTQGLSYFSDYWSCANVRVRGGPVGKKQPAVFVPGVKKPGTATIRQNACLASVNKLGVCRREPCLGIRGKWMTPAGARLGNSGNTDNSGVSPRGEPENKSGGNDSRNKRGRKLRVAALIVVDTRNGRRIARRTASGTVRVPRGARPGLVADVDGAAHRVSCYVGARVRPTSSESVAPYSCFGDVGPRAKPWPRPPYGKRVRVRVVARGNGGQRAQLSIWIRLERR